MWLSRSLYYAPLTKGIPSRVRQPASPGPGEFIPQARGHRVQKAFGAPEATNGFLISPRRLGEVCPPARGLNWSWSQTFPRIGIRIRPLDQDCWDRVYIHRGMLLAGKKLKGETIFHHRFAPTETKTNKKLTYWRFCQVVLEELASFLK